jgi:tape measure domain-containing protein
LAVELATAYISLVPTTVNLKPAMERQFAPVQGIAADAGRDSGNRFAEGFRSTTSKVGRSLGTALKTGISVATAAAAAAGAVGIKTAAQMEQSEISFTTMLGSAKKAKAFLGDLSKFAAKTPFDLPGLQKSASSLVSAGIDASKVIPIMTSLGNATSGMGTGAEGIQRATVALQQMNAAGKISGEDLNQLRDAGIPVFDLLTAATGKTTAQIAEMADKGKLGKEELQQLMKALETGKGLERFNGLMDKQSASLTGLWSTFKDTFAMGMANAIKPLIPLMKDGLGGATSFLTDKVFPRVTKFVAWLAVAIPGLHSLLTKGDFTGAFAKAFGVEEDSRIVGFLLDLRTNVSGTFTWFKDAVSGLYSFIAKNDYTGAFGRAFGTEESDASIGWMFSTRDAILNMFATIGDAANGLYALLVRNDYTGALRNAFGWEEDSQAVDFLLKLRAGVIDTAKAIRENTANLWSGLTMSQAEADAMTQPLEGAQLVGRNIRAFFGDVWKFIQSLDFSSFDAFFASLGDAGGQLGGALGSIGESVKALLPAIAEFSKQMPDLATGGVQLLAGALGFLADHVDTIIQFMPLIVAGFVAWRVAQLALNAAAAITPGLQLAVNISRISAARAEMGLAAAHRTSAAAIAGTNAAERVSLVTRLRTTAATIGQRVATVASAAAARAAAAGQWLLNAAMTANPIAIIVVAIAALVAGLVWFFTQTELGRQIIQNVWGAIQVFIGATVAWFQTYVLPTVLAIFRGVGAVFEWLWKNIIEPVFGFIGAYIGAWWKVVSFIFQALVAVIQRVIAPAILWFWNSVISPVFNFIAALVTWWWNNILKPQFDALVWVLQKVLAPAFDWLWKTIIKPAFDGIGTAIKWVWENVIKPVFDRLSDVIQKDIPKAFDEGVKFVKKVWEGIQEIVKAPIRFVVNTVLNDGLINAMNGIADFLKIDRLPRIALPQGFAAGGWTGPGTKYAPAGLVHADEHVIRKESRRRMEATAPGLLDHINRYGTVAGYAGGGRVAPLRGQLFVTNGWNHVHKGIDYAAAVGTPVFATQNGVVTHAGPGARAPGVWGGNEVHIAGNGFETWFAHLSQILVTLGQNVLMGQRIGMSGNTGISSGPHLHFGVFSGGWPNDIDPTSYLGGAGQPAGGGEGWNPIKDIISGLMDAFKSTFPNGGFFIDVVGGLGKTLMNGVADFVGHIFSGSTDKKGSLVYDGGGWLENTGGLQLIEHRSSRPDAVLTAPQWDTMTRIAENAAAGTAITIEGNVYGNPQDIVDELDARKRRALTLHNLGAITIGG